MVDGDTVALSAEHIRVLRIDVPEIFLPCCRYELIEGARVKVEEIRLIADHRVAIHRAGKGRYGPTLASMTIRERDKDSIPVADGLALPYRPGLRAHRTKTERRCGSEDC